MSTIIRGVLTQIKEKMTFDSGFVKQSIVIQTKENYPQSIQIDFTKEKTSLIENMAAGAEYDVYVNIRGREYNGKHYVNLEAWKVTGYMSSEGREAMDKANTESLKKAVDVLKANTDFETQEDDLPF